MIVGIKKEGICLDLPWPARIVLPATYAVSPPFYSCIQDWPDDPGHHNISDGTDSDIGAYECTAAQQTGLENWLNYR